MESSLHPIIYELKGVVYSVETLMSQDQDVDYHLIEKIQDLVNEAVQIIEKKQSIANMAIGFDEK